jgi:hypothetical protein
VVITFFSREMVEDVAAYSRLDGLLWACEAPSFHIPPEESGGTSIVLLALLLYGAKYDAQTGLVDEG